MKTVMVSGAGSGIGEATARAFAARGTRLIAVGRRLQPLVDLGLPDCLPLACDVSQPEAVGQLFAELDRRGLAVDTLINNAGIFTADKVLEMSEEAALEQLQVNTLGAWRLLKEAASRSIAAARELTVINVLSVTALQSYRGCALYGASKAALKSLMETARLELRGKGVRITNLYPGATETPVWTNPSVDFEKMMSAEEVATAIVTAAELQGRSLVEDLTIRPTLGDL
jgi:short-subunit dehydrogenase